MNLTKQLEESENFFEVEENTDFPDMSDMDTREFQNIIHRESNTVLFVVISEDGEGNTIYSSTFYFEIDDQPYWLETYVEEMIDIKRFRKNSEDFMVNVINDNEEMVK